MRFGANVLRYCHRILDQDRSAHQRIVVLAGVGVLLLLEVVAIVVLNGGRFVYSLDDPYIHLAVSDQIRDLEYGLNPGEGSTPSSSVLWPFLLAPTADTPLHVWTPLLLNSIATLAIALLLLRLVRVAMPELAHRHPRLSSAAIIALMLALNWIGVALTGMEHAAHVAASLAVGVGLMECAAGRRTPRYLLAGIALSPLLRYEGLGVAVAATGLLVWWRHWRSAMAALVAGVVPLVVFSAVAVSSGLSALPSSVLVKSSVLGGSAISGVASGAIEAFSQPLFVLVAAALVVPLLVRRDAVNVPLVLYALTVLAGHAAAGRFGWFGRYELYAYAAVLPAVVWTARGLLAGGLTLRRPGLVAAAATALLVVAALPYERATALTPLAAHDVYLQQAQMARFADEHWREPVAVNDVGLVGYEDPDYVLDLWGLANQEAREARQSEDGVAWVDRLVRRHGVSAAMIYEGESWFPEVPARWRRVARLSLSVPNVVLGGSEVSIVATTPQHARRLRAALERFAPSLPSGSELAFE